MIQNELNNSCRNQIVMKTKFFVLLFIFIVSLTTCEKTSFPRQVIEVTPENIITEFKNDMNMAAEQYKKYTLRSRIIIDSLSYPKEEPFFRKSNLSSINALYISADGCENYITYQLDFYAENLKKGDEICIQGNFKTVKNYSNGIIITLEHSEILF